MPAYGNYFESLTQHLRSHRTTKQPSKIKMNDNYSFICISNAKIKVSQSLLIWCDFSSKKVWIQQYETLDNQFY